ncbi:MATH domain and coiled-coil domain-containing protein At3g44790-like [Papaver somniferum]|uniref:MATH domain and coiled-coil domain-containing protein At3g44790-like n=1 Tax=Papaver somniferum TaxID=3469 RepID=UPI000E6FB0DE|nr:MATH domain and coiled-coil domain-containing protein At3g44790-like [Papaver somniferum]
MEVDESVGMLSEAVTPTKDIYPYQAPTQAGELTGVIEDVAEAIVSGAAKQIKFPGAGQLYEKGNRCKEVVLDGKYEDVGGFGVLKTQASLYKEIWLKYGHIASNQVLTYFYKSQVVVVSEIMASIVEMNRYRLEEVSPETIESWENAVKVAEKLEFNIGWLCERLEDIKKNFAEGKKLQETLMEQVQARVIEAEQQLVFAKEQVSALETKISQIMETQRQRVLQVL